MISPVITNPEFAFHTGTNCGPCEVFLLDVYLWDDGVFPLGLNGICELCRDVRVMLDLLDCDGILYCRVGVKLGTLDPIRDLWDGVGVPILLGVLYTLLGILELLLVVGRLLNIVPLFLVVI